MKIRSALSFLVLLTATLFSSSSASAGTINGKIQTASGGAVANGTLTFSLNQVAYLPTAQVVAQQVPCYTDNFGNIVGEPDQTIAPSASVNLGSGTLAAGTYFVKTALQDASGVSNVSPEAGFTLSAPGTLIVTAPGVQPANASGFRIYIGTASGNETLQGTVTGTPGTWANFSQAAALSAGSAMPVANTTVCTFAFTDSLNPTTTYYTINLVNAGGSKIAGYPISQARFYGGTNGSVNVSSGWPVSIGGVIWPSPIVSTPNSNITQSIAGGLNINGPVSVGGTLGAGSVSIPVIGIDPTSSTYGAKCNDNGTGNGTDDTVALQAASTAAIAIGGAVIIPDGKFCRFTTTLNLDQAIHVAIVGGLVTGRTRVGSVASLNAGLVYTGTASPVISARSSAGVAIKTSIYLTNAAFAGTVIDTSHVTSSDTQSFLLEDAVINASSTSCAVGLSWDKTIKSRTLNSTMFGCVEQIRGAATAGSYSVNNKIESTSFQPSSATTCFVSNPNGSFTLIQNDFEIGTAAVGTLCLTDTFVGPVTNLVGFGNFDGDAAGTATRTRYSFAGATLDGFTWIGNTIGGSSANDTAFNLPSFSKGVTINGNSSRGATFVSYLTGGGNQNIMLGPQDYSLVTFTGSFSTVGLANGYIWDNAGVATIQGAQISLVDANKTIISGGTGNNTIIHAHVSSTIFIGDTATIAETGGASVFGAVTAPSITPTGKQLLISNTAPTITAGGCGGAAASIATNNGTASFSVNVGTTPTTACTITMPTAANGWNCLASDITTNSTSVFLQKQTATGASSVTITNFNDVAVAANFTASDIMQVSCFAR